MGNKTIQERVLDLEQASVIVEAYLREIMDKLPKYDKIIQTRAKQAAILKRARRVKANKK